MNMILQDLLFPNLETCSDFEMYFRPTAGEAAAWVDAEAGALRVPKYTHVGLDTYFNSFSIGKWRRYTMLDNATLRLELSGAFQVQLAHWEMVGRKQFRHVFAERTCRADGREVFEFELPVGLAARGLFCCELYAVGEDCALYGGAYVTEVDAARLNPVDIAIDICTFRREAFIERNLALLNREFIYNPNSELRGHLDVFISDNGKTLDMHRLSSDRVHIVQNKNTGGSGGFARGMMEILDFRNTRAFSHVLVMDDDVLINTDALLRTYRLLRLLKPEYAGKTIAGAMLRLDRRWKQHECCGWWNGRYVECGKYEIDLRRIDKLLINENDGEYNFNAWWYSCIPMTKISNDNLPMPMFVRMDDVEFGLRTGGDVLSMNGICLWHEPFEYKFSSSMDYYEIRNLMTMNAIHRPQMGWRVGARQMLYRVLANVVRYRYKDIELIFRGVNDFLDGADGLMRRDAEALHKEIMAASDKFVPVEELDIHFDDRRYRKNLKKHKGGIHTARLLLLNGLFLPPKGAAVVDAFSASPWACYRRKALLNYNEVSHRGFVTRRSIVKSLSCIFRGFGMAFKLMRRYNAAAESYRQAQPVLTSRVFWNHYLELDK